MSNIPKLRFPEFSGEWEEKKLSDFMTRLTRKNSNNESSRALTISSVDGLIDQGEFFKKQIASKDTSGYYLLKKGDFAYNKSYSVGYNYGSIKRLDRYEDGVVSTLYICMSLTSDTNSDYLTHYFDSMKWNKSVSEISAEGARNHGLLNIPTEAFFQTKHFLAPSSQEQQKIANFLSNVDSIITAETKILNTLQKKKKALMQKLFTQQLRFKSDDGTDFPAWEEKKLGDVCNVLSGKRVPKGNKLTSVNTGLKYITVSDMGNKFVSNKDIKYITQEIETKIKKYKVITGDIIISVAGTLGKVNIITEEFNNANLTENCDKLTEFKGCITEYLFYFLQSDKFLDEINRIKTSSAQPKLALDRLRIFVIPIPIINEQQKIADCLSSMDSLIQTQQNVVTTWQQRKKALLQQMFI